MTTPTTIQYAAALRLTNISEVSRSTGRPRRTLYGYLRGEFRPSSDAAEELAGFLRQKADQLAAAADALTRTLAQEEK